MFNVNKATHNILVLNTQIISSKRNMYVSSALDPVNSLSQNPNDVSPEPRFRLCGQNFIKHLKRQMKMSPSFSASRTREFVAESMLCLQNRLCSENSPNLPCIFYFFSFLSLLTKTIVSNATGILLDDLMGPPYKKRHPRKAWNITAQGV